MATRDTKPDLRSLFGPEDFDPEFEPWVTHDTNLGMCIQHPLHYSIMHDPLLNAFANRSLERKKNAIKEATADSRWNSVVMLHERPWRFQALMEIAHRIQSLDDYWQLVRLVWTDSENIWQHEQEWRTLFNAHDRPERWRLMEPAELIWLREMSNRPLTIFRGVSRKARVKGLSWTLDREQAEWFANRFNPDTSLLAIGCVPKHLVIAYITERDEQEIIAYPEDINIQQVHIL